MSYVTKNIRLVVPANKAKPSPAIGQALGSVGINMMKFCKDFNAASSPFVDDLPLRVQLSVLNDGSYTFRLFQPQSSYFIRRMAGRERLAHSPGREVVGSVHCKQVYELACMKARDEGVVRVVGVQAVYKSLLASCKSYGVEVSFEREDDRNARIARDEARKKTLVAATPKGGKKTAKKK